MIQHDETKVYDNHLGEFRKLAYIDSSEKYETDYRNSLEDPEAFWGEQAGKYLTWQKPWDFVLKADYENAKFQWFGGGLINACYNCLDRHLPALENKVAYFCEGDDPGQSSVITYQELYNRVNKLSAALLAMGVEKGDRVVVYLPRTIELPMALLACARIGAVHNVVFGGLSPEALANRIRGCGAKIVLTADGRYRAGKRIALKRNVDEALTRCPDVQKVLVFKCCGLKPDFTPDRDVWWHEALADPNLPDFVPCAPMDSEDPLFILYTSGSTGRPKGLVHTHGGYLLQAAMTTRLVFDLKESDVFWCAANIDWITGHTYAVYGPLLNGLTSVLNEGVYFYPGFDRYWQIVAKYKVDKFYTAPTLIQSLAKEGPEHIAKHDVSSLKLLGSVGEPISPETWRWYRHHIGRDRTPIVDTWWQTETGGVMITPLPGVSPLKPGSCGLPFFGVDPVILDPETGREVQFPNQEGVLFIRRPWPGMARTVYNSHYQYKEAYFSLKPGFYFTGDGARKDEDGYFWITGRIDDVITVRNHRIGTAEIESALVLHENVAEAAVVGLPDPLKGQSIWAFVTLVTGAQKSEKLKDDLINLVRSEIGPIATIDAVVWADSLPKTLSGKILRRVLQKIALGHEDELGDISTIADPGVVKALINARNGKTDNAS